MNIKKLSQALLVASLFTLPFAARASSVSFTPATRSVEAGATFTTTVVMTPTETDYTGKLVLAFPADILQVVSFTQASGWLPLTQPGYDSVDNTNGTLIKTAGYAGGFLSPEIFGTVTFRAVKSGNATLTTGAGTQILDANNTNTFSSGGRSSIEVTSPAPLPVVSAPVTKPTTNSANPSRTPLTVKSKPVAALATSSLPDSSTSTVSATVSATSSAGESDAAVVASARTPDTSLVLGVASVLLAFTLGMFLGRRQKLSR